MEVLILHYHLNPGGVTRIIEAQVDALLSADPLCKIRIICGHSNERNFKEGVEIIADSRLDYADTGKGNNKDFIESVADLMSLIRSCLTANCILHCHNVNLGKNPALTLAVYKLSLEGLAVVNHCHDFAEDRPANLKLLDQLISPNIAVSLNEIFYPDLPGYHFIVLNSCDVDRLHDLGVIRSRVHLLANPVSIEIIPVTGSSDLKHRIYDMLGFKSLKKLCTYPVRAIERKNLGEFILFAVLFSDISYFAVTQPPRNPLEIKGYNRWKTFCIQNGIELVFEAGEKVSYAELIAVSDFCMTTSIREGFGMVYLEPWMSGTAVVGRELPCSIKDLEAMGIEFPRLYRKIIIRKSGKPVDFKDLGIPEQEHQILKLLRSREAKMQLLKDNSFLNSWFQEVPVPLIRKNQQTIRQKFSTKEYGKELFKIYREVSL
jgi:glycosyltransferase involved in cell wall biosynthesis